MELLKSLKNEIFVIISNTNLIPSNFNWESDYSNFSKGEISILRYINTDFFFNFEFINNQHHSFFSPGQNQQIEGYYPVSWMGQKRNINNWLLYLEREISQPNYWEEISKYKLPTDSIIKSDTSNESFSINEFETIVASLNQIKEYIKNQDLANEDQFTLVEEKLSYLEESAKRMGRKDWINICIGVLISTASSLLLNQEKLMAIFNIIKPVISGIIPLQPK